LGNSTPYYGKTVRKMQETQVVTSILEAIESNNNSITKIGNSAIINFLIKLAADLQELGLLSTFIKA